MAPESLSLFGTRLVHNLVIEGSRPPVEGNAAGAWGLASQYREGIMRMTKLGRASVLFAAALSLAVALLLQQSPSIRAEHGGDFPIGIPP